MSINGVERYHSLDFDPTLMMRIRNDHIAAAAPVEWRLVTAAILGMVGTGWAIHVESG